MSRFNRAWTRTRIGRGLNREAEQRLKEIYRRGWEDGKRDDQWRLEQAQAAPEVGAFNLYKPETHDE